jgi:hypothetical protein
VTVMCISTPAATLQTLPATALALRKRDSVGVMMVGGPMTWIRNLNRAAVSIRRPASQ